MTEQPPREETCFKTLQSSALVPAEWWRISPRARRRAMLESPRNPALPHRALRDPRVAEPASQPRRGSDTSDARLTSSNQRQPRGSRKGEAQLNLGQSGMTLNPAVSAVLKRTVARRAQTKASLSLSVFSSARSPSNSHKRQVHEYVLSEINRLLF